MSLNIVKLHQLIDQWAADERAKENAVLSSAQIDTPISGVAKDNVVIEMAETSVLSTPLSIPTEPAKLKRVLPEGQRVVRTKTSGDRVYLLDDNKKTRQWVATPEVLQGVGFEMEDVIEVNDAELLKYQMGPAIYKIPNGTA